MKNNVQSIERAFQILQVTQRHTAGVSVGELSAETELHTSTVSRIVSTLEHVGALRRVGGKVMIGEQIFTLASRATIEEQIISVALPILREVAADTGEAVGLTTIEGSDCVIFYQTPGTHHVRIRDWTGERFPLHVTSTGKLYLAGLSEPELVTYFVEPRAKVASATCVEEQVLRRELPRVTRDGVAWTVDELEDGLTSVAAAIRDGEGRFLAGLYLSLPSYRIEDRDGLARMIFKAARGISARL